MTRARMLWAEDGSLEAAECRECNRVMDATKLVRDASRPGGRATLCKTCHVARQARVHDKARLRTDEQIITDRRRLRPDGLKHCYRCGLYRPFAFFPPNRREPDGLRDTCTDCGRERDQR